MWKLESYGDKTALIEDTGRTMTYRELAAESARICAPVPARSLVFLFCENRIDSIAAYVGFLNHAIVPVMVKRDLEEELRARLIALYQPDYLYLPKELRGEFASLEAVYENETYVLLKSVKNNTAGQSGALYPDLALLLTTSGSTGSPKLVRQSYQNIASNTASIVEYLHLTADERAITTLPMSYTYGLSIINTHLMAGATLCLTELSILRGEFWEFFEKTQATSFGGVPYTYEILHKMRFTRRKYPSLRCMTQAGGKLSPELHRIFAQYAEENQKQFVVMYGQTEATARMAYLPPEKALEKAGSTGIVIPGGTLWLRDVDGSVITEPDKVGELIYKGENVTLGYAECRADLALGDERHGVLETGDMARRDADGYYYITGRLKRFLKLFGNRVNLDEIERLIRAAYPNVELACGGEDNLLKVYVVSEDEGLKKSIRDLLSEKTKISALGFQVVSVPEIPRNESGKIQYKLLNETGRKADV